MSEATEPTKVLIFAPEKRQWEAGAEIARVVWIFHIDTPYEVTSIDQFVAKWGSEGWDTPEFLERIMAAGYAAITNYRGLTKREAKEFKRLMDGTSTVAKARAEQETP